MSYGILKTVMKNAIITSADANVEDFLVSHWLKSLCASVDTTHIDIVILDYGLSKEVQQKLKKKCIVVVPDQSIEAREHIVNSRLHGIATFLEATKGEYDQVLCIDGGDIIFQADITELFEKNKTTIRAVSQNNLFTHFYLWSRYPQKKYSVHIDTAILLGNPVLNAGVLVGPAERVRETYEEAYSLIGDKSVFFPDQIILNYLLYRDGFCFLEEKYNYMKSMSKLSTTVKNGQIHAEGVGLVPIVHNLGRFRFARPFINFGFGKEYNSQENTFRNVLFTLAQHV